MSQNIGVSKFWDTRSRTFNPQAKSRRAWSCKHMLRESSAHKCSTPKVRKKVKSISLPVINRVAYSRVKAKPNRSRKRRAQSSKLWRILVLLWRQVRGSWARKHWGCDYQSSMWRVCMKFLLRQISLCCQSLLRRSSNQVRLSTHKQWRLRSPYSRMCWGWASYQQAQKIWQIQ